MRWAARLITAPAILLAGALSVSACGSSHLQTFGAIDQSDRSITVPPGNAGLNGYLKQRLRDAGWRLAVAGGPLRTTGAAGPDVNLTTEREATTRYRLLVTSRVYDVCLPSGVDAVDYDASVIDNRTGEEVIAQSGRDCAQRAAGKFMEAISGTAK